MSSRPNLYGLDRAGLGRFLERWEVPAYRAAQVYRWLYARDEPEPAAWTDLPRELRRRIAEQADVRIGRLTRRDTAADGTVKYRTELGRGGAVESVYMEQAGRVTLCVSSQVGCALGCDFCLTARMGLVRHLEPGEIAGQVALIRRDRGLEERAYNVVFMGMGEPLHNYDAVVAAFHLLVDPEGFGLGRRRVLVSTSGLAPAIERLGRESPAPRLAVSLNATTDAVRDRIMPINRRYPIDRLLRACTAYREASGEQVSFEYVLLAGVNDTDADVDRLDRIVRAQDAKLNLIPFNPVPEWLAYRAPTERRVLEIRDRLLRRRIPVSVRWSRGREARAACGQLALLGDAAPSTAPRTGRASNREMRP